MPRRACALTICAVLVLGAFLLQSFAQVGAAGAQLNGAVKDPSGSAVVGASITLRNVETNRSYTATTNTSGLYVIASAPPGRYELTTAAGGFAKSVLTGIVLTVGQTATIDVTLKVASVQETVTVTTETPVIEPTRTEISQVIETQQIDSLPISNRVFTDFALLTPGVATSRTSLGATITEFETTQISFGGMRGFSNEVTVDGADFVNVLSSVQRATPPQESAQEFRVVNNTFGAEYGRAAGGIVNIVTKSGTNELHGSLYGYLQNSAVDARYALQPSPLPHTLRQGQFGATLGGPLKKDRTFFFLNYEGRRRGDSPVYPPDLISNLDLIDHSKAVLGLAPEGCSQGLASCTASNASYLNGFLKTENDDTGFVRLDHQISQNNRLGIRYNVLDTRASGELVGQTLDGGGIGVPSGGRDLFVRDQSLFGTVNSLLKPNLVNQVLVQWARRHYNFPGQTGQPDFSLLNDLELGHNFGIDDRKYESRVQFSDSLSWVKGNHVWKFGFDGNYIQDVDNFPGFTPVRLLIPAAGITPIDCLANFAFFFNGGPTAFPDVNVAGDPATTACPVAGDHGVVVTYAGVPLPTDPNACSASPCLPLVTSTNNPLDTATWANAFQPSLFGNYSKQINHGYWAGYFQDQWRVTSKFTLNFGLRWEFESGLSKIVDPDYRGWQPRVGFAYSPDSKTVIRAGFGIFDDRYNLSFFFIPNTQKVVGGYLCDNHAPSSIAALCSASGVLPQNLPYLQSGLGQATQGYQLFALPAASGAAAVAASVISTGGYDAFENPFTGSIALAGTCFLNGACGVGSGGMDHRARIPYSQQASLQIDRQFGKGFSMSAAYLFVGAHKFVRGNNVNIPCAVGTTKSAPPTDPLFPGGPSEWVPGLLNADGTLSPCSGTPTLGTGALAGVGPFFAGALGSGLQTISAGLQDFNNNVANAVYHGLTISGQERVGHYLTFNANYTYSHTIDNGNFTTFVNLPVNQFDYTAERGNSNQDLRHRFVMNFTATAPNTGWYRNFQFSSIVTVQSGRPFTIFAGADTLNDLAGGATDRVGGAPLASAGSCPSVGHCKTLIGRNTYFGDGLRTWDLRFGRTVHFRENMALDLTLDAFNVLNRTNVDEVNPVYGSPVFCGGVIPKRFGDATTKAIQQGSLNCPVGDGFAIPGVGSFATTPITVAEGQTCTFPPGSSCAFIPATANVNFGKARTLLNPRQLQFGVKFTF